MSRRLGDGRVGGRVAQQTSLCRWAGGDALSQPGTGARQFHQQHRGGRVLHEDGRGEISGKTPIVQIGGGLSRGAGVTWSLKDPITQVLILRDALKSSGSLYGLDSVGPGRYISFTGHAFISRPGIFEDMHRTELRERPGLYDSLEAERAKVDDTIRITEAPERQHWLLTVSEGASICAAILNSQWLRPEFADWIDADYRHEIIGLFRRKHKSGVPILATLHLGVCW